jgi:hypothetical protein
MLDLTCFYKDKRSRDGLSYSCKDCKNSFKRSRNIKINTDTNLKKMCYSCNNYYPATINYFHRSHCSSFGVSCICRECDKNRSKNRKIEINTNEEKLQTCIDCKNQYPATYDYFYKNPKTKNGTSSRCKNCNKKWDREHRFNINKYKKERYYNDIKYRITVLLRSRVGQAIKKGKGVKFKKTMELVGCDLESLKKHLESLFVDGMTWDNCGEWHIDHIRPCSSFDLTKESEQKICFHYSNLQPLWATENLKKSDSYNVNNTHTLQKNQSCS